MCWRPELKLGGISIQRRRDGYFPSATLPSHPKGWIRTWFYCKNTALADENPLLGYRVDRLPMDFNPPSKIIPEEHAESLPAYSKVRALLANGLTGVDLAWCWVAWKILPLSRRTGLMCEYSGEPNDPQRYNSVNFTTNEVNKTVKSLLGKNQENYNKTGLLPFYKLNPAPAVSIPLYLAFKDSYLPL